MAENKAGPSSSSTSALTKPRKPRIDFESLSPEEILQLNRTVASPFQVSKHKKDAARNWDIFYKNNKDGFFKDRHWTDREFEVLADLEKEQQQTADRKGKGKVILEAGCGTGAFVYPLLERYPATQYYAFDFSPRAVDLVKRHTLYTTDRVHAFVHDLTCPPGTRTLSEQLVSAPPEFRTFGMKEMETVPDDRHFVAPDIISCIFVLSALPPGKQIPALRSLLSTLAPGGSFLFRDYAIYDQAQLRFHALPSGGYATVPSLLSAPADDETSTDGNADGKSADEAEKGKAWYRRGDGTMTYFFRADEFNEMVREAATEPDEQGLRYEMVGGCQVMERTLENKAQQWACTRRFVHGSWEKVLSD